MRPRPLGFAARLGLASSLLIIVACIAQSSVLARGLLDDVARQLTHRGTTLTRYLARAAGGLAATGDVEGLREVAERALAQADVLYFRVFDPNGLLLVSMGTPPPGGVEATDAGDGTPITVAPDVWEFRAPVTAPDASPARPLAIAALGLSTASLAALWREAITTTILFTLLVTTLAVGAAVAGARAITRPLGALADAADAIASGDLETTVAVDRHDEVGAVARSFNAMAKRLLEHRITLEQYSQALEANVHELERASHLKSEFLATVSHELRTPLNVILGYLEMLRDGAAGALSDEQTALLADIERHSLVQLELITSVLDFSRLTEGRVTYRVERFAIAPLLEELRALYAPRAERQGIRLEVEVDPHLPVLETDRVKLQEILRNLVDNAVKFTERGAVWIRARAERASGRLVIEVLDTGPGIAEAELEVIFDAFHQVGASSTRETSGVGLGLSIVRRLAEVLGGTVSVSSRPGRGATFRLTIPVHLAAVAPEAGDPATAALDQTARNAAAVPAAGAPRRRGRPDDETERGPAS